jgi:hypothetical protein
MSIVEGGGIFVSYRRDDSGDAAGRLADHLIGRFGAANVFIDVETIKPGADFADAITRAVRACKVLVAVIGPGWQGRRLDDPEDWVRVEVGTALALGVRVIPVLVGDAVMPDRANLPGDLAGLARRSALRVRHDSFRADAARLAEAIAQVLAPSASGSSARPPAPVGNGPGYSDERSAGFESQAVSLPGLGQPEWAVARPEARRIVAALLRRRVGNTGVTVTLAGAGGFGKTTLASMVCADERVRRRFGGRIHWVTLGRDARDPSVLARKVNEVIGQVAGGVSTFVEPGSAGEHLRDLLKSGPRRLLVLDGVWEKDHLVPFGLAAKRCSYLVTTRNPELLTDRGLQVLWKWIRWRRTRPSNCLGTGCGFLTPHKSKN